MNQLFDNFKLPPKKSLRGGKRAELIQQFVDQINKDRIGTKFKPVSAKGVAILINQHPNLKELDQLYRFYGMCKESKVFSKYFYWIVKPKKND